MPSNLYITPLEILRQMFADSAAFRTWTGAASAAIAFSENTFSDVEDFPTELEKFVVIGNSEEALSGIRDAQGLGIGAFKQSVGVVATLMFLQEENQESTLWYGHLKEMTIAVGDILKGVLGESGKDGNLLFASYNASRVFRSERNGEDKYLYAVFEFDTGT